MENNFQSSMYFFLCKWYLLRYINHGLRFCFKVYSLFVSNSSISAMWQYSSSSSLTQSLGSSIRFLSACSRQFCQLSLLNCSWIHLLCYFWRCFCFNFEAVSSHRFTHKSLFLVLTIIASDVVRISISFRMKIKNWK